MEDRWKEELRRLTVIRVVMFQHVLHTDWPELRSIARKLKMTQKAVRNYVEESDSLDMIVGYRVGSGLGELKGGSQKIEFTG